MLSKKKNTAAVHTRKKKAVVTRTPADKEKGKKNTTNIGGGGTSPRDPARERSLRRREGLGRGSTRKNNQREDIQDKKREGTVSRNELQVRVVPKGVHSNQKIAK